MILVILCAVALGCMLLTMMVYKRFWNRGLIAQVRFVREQVDEGQIFLLQEIVENRKLLPLPTLTVKFQMARDIRYVNTENTSRTDKQYRNDCIPIMPYQRVTRSLELMGDRRDYYSIDEINLVATDLFFRQTLAEHVANQAWIYICPARSKFTGFSKLSQHMYGECVSNRMLQEDPFEFKGIRDYTVTDSIRKVNWKASAKSGSLKVNQFYDTTGQQLTIFLNMEQKGILKYEDLLEESIRVTRNFIEDFVRKGIPVMLISNGVDRLTGQEIWLQAGAGLTHIDFCLRQLAKLHAPEHMRGMEELLKEQAMRRRCGVQEVTLLISAEQSPKLAQAYLEYVGVGSSANWLIPIHQDTMEYLTNTIGIENVRGKYGNYIHTEYLIMEQMK